MNFQSWKIFDQSSIFCQKNVVLRLLDAHRGYTFFTALECSRRLFQRKRSRRALRKKFNTFCEAEKKSHIFENRINIRYATFYNDFIQQNIINQLGLDQMR